MTTRVLDKEEWKWYCPQCNKTLSDKDVALQSHTVAGRVHQVTRKPMSYIQERMNGAIR
jgi:hypothetical protein